MHHISWCNVLVYAFCYESLFKWILTIPPLPPRTLQKTQKKRNKKQTNTTTNKQTKNIEILQSYRWKIAHSSWILHAVSKWSIQGIGNDSVCIFYMLYGQVNQFSVIMLLWKNPTILISQKTITNAHNSLRCNRRSNYSWNLYPYSDALFTAVGDILHFVWFTANIHLTRIQTFKCRQDLQ